MAHFVAFLVFAASLSLRILATSSSVDLPNLAMFVVVADDNSLPVAFDYGTMGLTKGYFPGVISLEGYFPGVISPAGHFSGVISPMLQFR